MAYKRTYGKSGHIRRLVFVFLAIVLCVSLLPAPVLAQSTQLRTYIEDNPIQTNGLISIVADPPIPEYIEPPATFQVTVENIAGSLGAGVWLGLDCRVVGQIRVVLKSLEFTKPGQQEGKEIVILPPGESATYEITFEGPGSIVFFADLTQTWAIGLYVLQNLLRLLPQAGGLIGEAPALVFEMADMFPTLWEVLASAGDALILRDTGSLKNLGLSALGIIDWLNTPSNRIDLLYAISDKLKLGWDTTQVAGISTAMAKLSWIYSITRALMDITQFVMNVALGEVAGWVEVGALVQTVLNPNVSVSPSTGSSGTRFAVRWSGFSPNHRLTQYLQRRGSAQPNVVLVTTDGLGKATSVVDSQVLSPGTYELWGVDIGSGASSNKVEFVVTGDVDLSPYTVSFSPSTVFIGDGLSVTFGVKNNGNAASGFFSVWVYASTSPYGTENIIAKVPFSSIGQGASQMAIVNVLVPASLDPGEYYVTVYADAPGDGVVQESHEDNNIGSSSQNRLSVRSAEQSVTLTLYVHENSASGPIIAGALVTGYDGAGNYFSQTTNSAGYVTITGVPGTWSFTASKSGYDTNSWSQSITSTCEKHAYLVKQVTYVTLGEAVDNTGLTWTTGGNASWFGQTTVSYYGSDAAQSGAISDNQLTWLRTTVTGPGTLTFYWKVSSQAGSDGLEFYVDGLPWAAASGSVDWQQLSFPISSGTHTLEWRYTKDSYGSSGSDCGWVDKVEFTLGSPLGEALDNTDLTWTTGGNANWFRQTAVSYYGGDAAQSGAIGDNQVTWLRTTVTGPGTLTFYWKVSSQAIGDDFLAFYIDGLPWAAASGSVDWQQLSFPISSGTHTLEWRYTKDSYGSGGSDCGWVDKVEFTP